MPPIDSATSLLRRAATVALALPLLYLVLMLGQATGGALGFVVVLALTEFYSPTIAWSVVVAVVAGAWAGLYAAVPPARFVMRIFPLRAEGGRRWGVMVLSTLMATSVLVFMLWLRIYPSAAEGAIAGPERLVLDLAVIVTGLLVLVALYLRPEARWPGRRVLYLRRFRSFSDRVVYRTLLAALPSGARVTALVPAHGGPRDLDPFTVAFAGLRWRRPVAGIPQLLVSDDADWPHHVQRMIEHADCIVVDGSADSEAMAAEYALLNRLQAGVRTVVLRDEVATGAAPAIPGATMLRYRRSLWPSLLRGGFWLALFAAYAVMSWRDSYNFPTIVLTIFPLILPAIFQRSVERASLRDLKLELERRVGCREALPLPLLRASLASLALATAAWLGLYAAAASWRPVPADDARALDGLDGKLPSQSLRIGAQFVDFPLPPGFVNPKDLLVEVRGKLGTLPGDAGQVLAVFVPLGTVFDVMVGQPAASSATMVAWLSPGTEVPVIDVAQFQAQLGDRDGREQMLRALGATSVVVEAAGDRALLQALDLPVSEAAPEGKSCAIAVVLVRGKPLGMTLCRLHSGDGAAERRWVRVVAARWLDEVQRRNPALPPVPPGRLGMAGTVSISGSLEQPAGKAVVTTIRVEEVVPGTPPYRAGLQPGDEIVAIDGKPLVPPEGRLSEKFAQLASGASLRLDVRRDGTVLELRLVKP